MANPIIGRRLRKDNAICPAGRAWNITAREGKICGIYGQISGTMAAPRPIIANATSDSDGDGVSDLVEFRNSGLGMDPTAVDAPLPVSGVFGTIMLLAAILAFGSRRRR